MDRSPEKAKDGIFKGDEMVIEVKFKYGHQHRIVVEAHLKNEVLTYVATLEETGFISHFDSRQEYAGATIEEALTKISKAIGAALDLMHSE